MKGVFLTKSGIEIRETEIPKIKEDEILVKLIANGICGGDLANYRQVKNGTLNIEAELIGHEGTGIVEKIGSHVANVKVGDIVSTDKGTMSEYYVCKAAAAIVVPKGIEPEWALGEPVACCVHGAMRFGITLGDRVAFMGCGFMGLVSLQLAKMQGASKIVAMDYVQWRLDLAKKLGADRTILLSKDTTVESLGLADDFDVVVEATGAQGAVDMATQMVKEHGKLVLMGYHTTKGGMRQVNMERWNYKAIDVVNAHIRDLAVKMDAFDRAFKLMSAGKLEIKSLNKCYPMSKAAEAFKDLDEVREGLVKVSIIPG